MVRPVAGLLAVSVLAVGCGEPRASGRGLVEGTTPEGDLSLSGRWIGRGDGTHFLGSGSPYFRDGFPLLAHHSYPRSDWDMPTRGMDMFLVPEMDEPLAPGATSAILGRFDGTDFSGGTAVVEWIEFTGRGHHPHRIHYVLEGTIAAGDHEIAVDVEAEAPTFCGDTFIYPAGNSGDEWCSSPQSGDGEPVSGTVVEEMNTCPADLVDAVVGDRQYDMNSGRVEFDLGQRFGCTILGDGLYGACGLSKRIRAGDCAWQVDGWATERGVTVHGIPEGCAAYAEPCSARFQMQ